MGKLKWMIKRAGKYILHGVPSVPVNVTITPVQYGGILEGKRILITGGGRGLGYDMARKCLEEKAKVTITGRNMETLEEAKEKLGNNPNLFLIQHDVREIATTKDMVEKAGEMMGGIDCLVNNAGVSVHNINYKTCTEEQWDRQMDTNLKGTYFTTQEFLKYYEASGETCCNIINMVSERGLYGDDVPYGLAKRALISYTEGLARALIRKGVRVNAIAPGVTATEMTGYDPEGDLYRRWAVGKRVLLPQEISEVAVFLLSDASNCISGQVIACNEANHLK